jgi:peptide-methionine (S)-S-oxide reductase
VEIDFDPQQVGYEELLEEYLRQGHPTMPPYSVQYRSAIFYHGAAQKAAAEKVLARWADAAGHKLYVSLEPATEFYRAEDYHHKYYLRSDKVLMQSLSNLLPTEQDFEDSTMVMRLNALEGGYVLTPEMAAQLPLDQLSEGAQARVKALQERGGGPKIRCG